MDDVRCIMEDGKHISPHTSYIIRDTFSIIYLNLKNEISHYR